MTKEKYNEKLKNLGITKKELASMLGVAEQTVNNWGSTNKVPYWIESWLDNYEKAKTYSDIKEKIFKIEGIE